MGKLADLRLDDATWSAATPLRRAEWRAARQDVVEDEHFADALDGLYMLVGVHADAIELEALDLDGHVVLAFTIPRAPLAPSIDEYVAIIHRLDTEVPSRDASWFEAVDMAKRVAHDGAARALARTVPGLSTELATLRRVFTLVLSLFVDTTTMHHKRHGP